MTLRVGDRSWRGPARAVLDAGEIADLLELRRRRHPVMVPLIMTAEGVAPWASRARLERFAAGKAILVIGEVEEVEPETRRPTCTGVPGPRGRPGLARRGFPPGLEGCRSDPAHAPLTDC